MKRCFSCKNELDVKGKPGRGDTCPSCGADIRVCLNCRFYDDGAYNRCREPQAERVLEKEKANFCDYFDFRDSEDAGKGGMKEDARKKLDELFGG